MNTVVRVLPPGKLASARSYMAHEADFGSGYIDFTFRENAVNWIRSCCHRDVLLNNPVEHGSDVAAELRGIFTHWEMTELLHDDDFRTLYACRRPQGIGGRAREKIFSRPPEHTAPGGFKRRK